MKRLIVVIISLFFSALTLAGTLNTPHYKIVITCLSPENTAGCQKAKYQATNKATGVRIDLIGQQVVRMCPDGTTPCHSLGYEFADGKATYLVSEEGQLQVLDDAKVVVDESGEWTY